MDGLLCCIGAAQSLLVLLGLDLHPSISFCITISTPLTHLTHDIRHFSYPGGAPLFPPNSSYCLSISILIHRKLTSIPTLLDITNRAKPHWNSISPTRQAQIIQNYKEHLQLLCAIDELCVSALVGPDEMGDLVDEIETMFDWYHSNCLARLLFWFYLLSFLYH